MTRYKFTFLLTKKKKKVNMMKVNITIGTSLM